ncbi:inositol monophosphatase family protein [Prochlorococcus sp. MIT 1307]|uniref:inositol monophosphatase family protein n=1 Tax=Prochlorococcus sp. MIT 1307 TaxID=3096219 RepID=UPI002A75D785|nr:inositol monophosphatase family protein [Prochlorococcus sp. MIT 1307]
MNFSTLPNSLTKLQISKVNELLDLVAKRQLEDFGNITSDIKDDGTLITSCDRWSDSTIVKNLGEISPKEGVLSEEGSKKVPDSNAYWVVDPLDGTTNFSAGIPYWAISIARFANGKPDTAFLDLPALKKRILAIRGQGVWLNGKKLTKKSRLTSNSACVSLCSRSIRILQRRPDKPFPGKIRLLGVSSLNMVGVAIGQTIAALEATPKIWDLASAWLILSELDCSIKWLDIDPSELKAGQDLTKVNFPLLTASSSTELEKLLPWAEVLMHSWIDIQDNIK